MSRRIERDRALREHVRAYAPRVHELLPVSLDEVERALAGVDVGAVAAGICAQLEDALANGERSHPARTEALRAEALRFEWYAGAKGRYDSVTSGTVAERCVLRGYSNTDLVKLGPAFAIEREEPELAGDVHEIGGFDIAPVMARWYEDLAHRFDDVDYAPLLGTPHHAPFNEAQNAFHELFRLRLYECVDAACATGRLGVRRVFACTHERWPVLVHGEAGDDA